MIRTRINDATRDQLQALRRKPLPPKVRDRIEMLLRSDAGWSAPRIAAHLGYCGQTVRDVLRASLARGLEALYPFRSGPAPDLVHRGRVAEELRPLLAEDRTWTSRQLSLALAERGLVLGPRQVRRHLKRIKAGYRRTASTRKHKQDTQSRPSGPDASWPTSRRKPPPGDWCSTISTSAASRLPYRRVTPGPGRGSAN